MNLSLVSKIADAIAFAEGFYVPGSRPRRNNNPGDLERDVTGKGVGMDGPYVIYATPQDGWDALKHQVMLMFAGSHVYQPSMTIAEMASHYTSTEAGPWSLNVARRLGVPVTTQLDQIV